MIDLQNCRTAELHHGTHERMNEAQYVVLSNIDVLGFGRQTTYIDSFRLILKRSSLE